MIRAAIRGRHILFVIVWVALLSSCARVPPDTGRTLLKPKTFSDLQGYLLNHKADLEQFRLRGPFEVATQDDYEIRLSTTELIHTDLFLASHGEKAPLVVFLHGYDASKEAHAYQAMHLASWGMHCMTLQLPNKGPWIGNGKTLAKIVNFIRRWPEIVDGRVDVSKIILVGHSFGGASVAVALAEGAPAVGGILLDPAVVGNQFPKLLSQVKTPVLVLGADEYVSLARNRDYFYRYIPGGISEISITDAVHEDAQFPSDVGLATEELQVTFVSAITAAVFSLSAAGNFEYAWAGFNIAPANRRFFNAKKK